MKSNKDILDGMSIFAQVVENEGFSSAAKKLGNSTSYISKEVTKLEQRLGVRLLNRTTRSISLTDMGQEYYIRCRQILEDAEEAERSIQQQQENPQGFLKVSAPISLNQASLVHILPEFMARYPDIRLDIDLSDRFVDVVEEGFDLVIRGGTLPDSNLVSRLLMMDEAVIIASADYLERYGTPQTPKDLVHHHAIAYSYRKNPNVWDFQEPSGKKYSVNLTPRVYCNNAELQKAFAMQGIGICSVPSFTCRPELASGKLVRILSDYEARSIGVYALYPHRQHLSTKVRVFIDFMKDHLACPIHFPEGPPKKLRID
ncbi:MAG: LysR family transcriptional regulator [Sneathiellales bacterium]|nr:LysR family transcriptional regulator [Sneathiellales bacterium]